LSLFLYHQNNGHLLHHLWLQSVTYKKQIVAKGGAEGVHCFGDRETGLGVAIKVEDGNGRGTSVASMEVLRQLKIGEQGMLEQLGSHKDILNTRDNVVGKIASDFSLNFT